MLAKPSRLIDRGHEWMALERFVERRGRLAVLYGPRRMGKSFLIDAVCEATEGLRYQAITGTPATQLADFAKQLGEWLGVGELRIDSWSDALQRLSRLSAPFVAIDELPYLTETSPELAGLLQRYVDSGSGPSLILAGSAMSTMSELIAGSAPLYGRASSVIVPSPFAGRHLRELWGADDPLATLWIDAALGGRPGYRPLVPPPYDDLDAWMTDALLAPGSPLLDAAEADLAEIDEPMALRGVYRAILGAIASGERTFSAISRVAGLPSGALSRPLSALVRAQLVRRIPDPLRARRDRYELADPYLRTWLSIIAPSRSLLQAGRGKEVWGAVNESTWRSQVLGPRWEAVVRDHVAGGMQGFVAADGMQPFGPVDAVGVSTVSDRIQKRSHEIDLLALREGRIVAIGEAKLRALGRDDLTRLLRIREILGEPTAAIVLASTVSVDLPADAPPEVIEIGPGDVYG